MDRIQKTGEREDSSGSAARQSEWNAKNPKPSYHTTKEHEQRGNRVLNKSSGPRNYYDRYNKGHGPPMNNDNDKLPPGRQAYPWEKSRRLGGFGRDSDWMRSGPPHRVTPAIQANNNGPYWQAPLQWPPQQQPQQGPIPQWQTWQGTFHHQVMGMPCTTISTVVYGSVSTTLQPPVMLNSQGSNARNDQHGFPSHHHRKMTPPTAPQYRFCYYPTTDNCCKAGRQPHQNNVPYSGPPREYPQQTNPATGRFPRGIPRQGTGSRLNESGGTHSSHRLDGHFGKSGDDKDKADLGKNDVDGPLWGGNVGRRPESSSHLAYSSSSSSAPTSSSSSSGGDYDSDEIKTPDATVTEDSAQAEFRKEREYLIGLRPLPLDGGIWKHNPEVGIESEVVKDTEEELEAEMPAGRERVEGAAAVKKVDKHEMTLKERSAGINLESEMDVPEYSTLGSRSSAYSGTRYFGNTREPSRWEGFKGDKFDRK